MIPWSSETLIAVIVGLIGGMLGVYMTGVTRTGPVERACVRTGRTGAARPNRILAKAQPSPRPRPAAAPLAPAVLPDRRPGDG